MKQVRDILLELEALPTDLRGEIILRAQVQQTKANALILARLSDVVARLEEKEAHLVRLINRMEQLGWETAIRNEIERRSRENECKEARKRLKSIKR